MRDIKFKAFSDGVMYEYAMPTLDGGKVNVSHNENGSWNKYVNIEDCELMQYTGLKDRKGKEIYEGDIFKYRYYPLGANPEVYEYFKIGVIEFRYNSYGVTYKFECGKQLEAERCMSHERDRKEIYRHPTEGEDWFDSSISFSRLEVIGNRFENPELLK